MKSRIGQVDYPEHVRIVLELLIEAGNVAGGVDRHLDHGAPGEIDAECGPVDVLAPLEHVLVVCVILLIAGAGEQLGQPAFFLPPLDLTRFDCGFLFGDGGKAGFLVEDYFGQLAGAEIDQGLHGLVGAVLRQPVEEFDVNHPGTYQFVCDITYLAPTVVVLAVHDPRIVLVNGGDIGLNAGLKTG